MTNAFRFESVDVANKPVSLPIKPDDEPELAVVTCERECRYRFDGGDPDGLVGHLLRDGDRITLLGELNISQFKAISTSEVPATL